MPTDLTIEIPEDRPSGVAEVGEALGAAGVNIQGRFRAARHGEVHVLVEEAGTRG